MSQFRNSQATVPVDYTVGGQTFRIDRPTGVKEVRKPVDLDAVVTGALTAITVVVVAGAMAWSTVAIGTLLHRMAPAWVSYTVAVVFDLAWVACMGAEWLMRYDGKRVWIPRVAGFAALAVSVLTIVLEGDLTTHSLVIGAAGAMISVLAKGLWTVVMMISTRRLSELDRLWYAKASSAAAAELAMTAIQRKLVRTQARAAQERAALGIPDPVVSLEPVPDPVAAPVSVPQSGSALVPAPVRTPSAQSGSAPAPVRTPSAQSGSAPASVPQSGSGLGPVIDRVWVRIRNGMDPVADRNGIVADILEQDPSVDPETVRRMIRTARHALAAQTTTTVQNP